MADEIERTDIEAIAWAIYKNTSEEVSFADAEDAAKAAWAEARQRCAKLVEAMIHEVPWKDQQWARAALIIAARAIRRGRHLTEREKLLNLASSIEEADREHGDDSFAEVTAKIRRIADAETPR